MATYQSCKTVSVLAGSAVTIYRFVALAADGKYDHVGSAQGRADGVAAEGVAAEDDVFPMAVPDGAIVKVEAGAAVTRGAQVASDDVGRVIAHVTTAGNYILGTALDAAGAAGEVIRVQFSVHQDGA
jgi:hypothetical protein